MFKHFLLTRWNLLDAKTTIYNNPQVPDPRAWTKHRIRLFNEYCLPNVMLQKGKFTWLLSFAPETPKWIIEEYSTFPHVKIIFEYPADWLRGQYGKTLFDGDWIITSRLDNDDTISVDYIEKVQAQFNEQFLLVDTDGVQMNVFTKKRYTVDRKSNNSPFISLIEQVGTPWQSISEDPGESKLIDISIKTVFYCSHSKMEWHFPSMKINENLYTMNLHDRNICNKIVGYKII